MPSYHTNTTNISSIVILYQQYYINYFHLGVDFKNTMCNPDSFTSLECNNTKNDLRL